ncbi:hypothetical protein SEA_TASP14_90 [Mycobacterium phage Tasp14]|uniref:hypothetical protein n=1 Tax=Mycobacterium phage Tasp14 TaxID=1698420 RepID=UPI0006BCFCD4|nr:hypothetical protein AVV04_gp05 [Mycobacterium phage Tasp14]ALA11980.1 hypothetical protein SEA_TASP14_90 [Mycobacterium phage Tasp14]
MSPVTPSAGVHPVYHTPTRQRNPLCAASLHTPGRRAPHPAYPAPPARTRPAHPHPQGQPCLPLRPSYPQRPLPVRRPVPDATAPRHRGCAELDADSTADAMRARDRRGSASRGWLSFEIELTFRIEARVRRRIGSMDRGRVRRMLRAFGVRSRGG